MNHEICVNSTKENREEIINKLNKYGKFTEKWPDGTFNIEPYNNECSDRISDICEELGIEVEYI